MRSRCRRRSGRVVARHGPVIDLVSRQARVINGIPGQGDAAGKRRQRQQHEQCGQDAALDPCQRSARSETRLNFSPPCLLEKDPRGTRPSLGNLAALSRSGFRPMALRPALSDGLPFSKLEMNLWGQLFRRSVRSTFFGVPQVSRTVPAIDSPRAIRSNDNSIELCHRHSKGRRRIIVVRALGTWTEGHAMGIHGKCTELVHLLRRVSGMIRNGIPELCDRRALRPFRKAPPDVRQAVRSRGRNYAARRGAA